MEKPTENFLAFLKPIQPATKLHSKGGARQRKYDGYISIDMSQPATTSYAISLNVFMKKQGLVKDDGIAEVWFYNTPLGVVLTLQPNENVKPFAFKKRYSVLYSRELAELILTKAGFKLSSSKFLFVLKPVSEGYYLITEVEQTDKETRKRPKK